jgi:cyclophilin family peptidyl-prolyl cis-trans isomerase
MPMVARVAVGFVIALAVPLVAWGQEAAAPAAASQEEQAQFRELYAQWKSVTGDIRKIQEEYSGANRERRAELEKEHAELLEKVEALEPQLKELGPAAEAIYRADSQDKDAEDFVAYRTQGAFVNDDYEEALRLGKLLIDNGFDNKRVYDLAGIAAFRVMDLDTAEEYLTAAGDAGALSPIGEDLLGSVSDYREYWAKEQDLRAAEAQADDLPRVLLKTSAGDITLELLEDQAPNAVANFISLVEDKFYNGVVFHRVLPGFMAQGGDPTGTGSGGPGYRIKCECYRKDFRRHFRGSLSMAHAGRDTGGSQFFLTFHPTSHLDGKHTVFGRVIDGFDVLSKLKRIDPEDPQGGEPDRIVEAKVLRKRNHKYEPETLEEN